MSNRDFQIDDKNLEMEFQRIVTRQIELALDALDATSTDLESGVHNARKSLKRLRACYQLIRSANKTEFRHKNRLFREIARLLSGTRDRQVLLNTLDSLGESNPALAQQSSFIEVRNYFALQTSIQVERMQTQIDAATMRLRQVLDELKSTRHSWVDESVIFQGLDKNYRRCRSWRDAAYASELDADFHRWRKVVKYHLYHIYMLQKLGKTLDKRRQRTEHLGELLGDFHDLCLLEQQLLFVPGGKHAELQTAIAKAKAKKLKKARKLGDQLFSETAAEHADRLHSQWKKAFR